MLCCLSYFFRSYFNDISVPQTVLRQIHTVSPGNEFYMFQCMCVNEWCIYIYIYMSFTLTFVWVFFLAKDMYLRICPFRNNNVSIAEETHFNHAYLVVPISCNPQNVQTAHRYNHSSYTTLFLWQQYFILFRVFLLCHNYYSIIWLPAILSGM